MRNRWPKSIRRLPPWRLRSEQQADREELVTEEWPGVAKMEADKHYHAQDLEEVRHEFLRTRRNPKVALGGVRDIRR